MSTLARTLGLLLFTSSLVACDSSDDFDACAPSDEPGARRGACPKSVFPEEHFRGREIGGLVRRGEDVVPGAIVRVEPSAGFRSGTSVAPTSTVTNAVGAFVGLRDVAFRYDLSVRFDPSGGAAPDGVPRDDVLFFRGLAGRYIEPSIEGPRTFARAWSSHVDLKLDRPVPAERSLAFFASGDGIYTATGDLASGLTVLARTYAATATLHVIEYETAAGLGKATAYGKVDALVDAGTPRIASVVLEPVDRFAEPTFAVAAPQGFTPATVDIRFGFTRISDAVVAKVPVGGVQKIPIIPDASYTYQVVAAADGMVIDTGENGFDVFRPVTEIELPEPTMPAVPLEGESRGVGDPLVVDGKGVFEHVLVSQAGGPSIRVITAQRETGLPDVASLGGAPAAGPYAWTVRRYPTAQFVEAIGGLDSRRYRPMSVSRPRTIVLR